MTEPEFNDPAAAHCWAYPSCGSSYSTEAHLTNKIHKSNSIQGMEHHSN